jgi:integrase
VSDENLPAPTEPDDAADTTVAYLKKLERLDPEAFSELSPEAIAEGQLAGRAFLDDTLVGKLLAEGSEPGRVLAEWRRAAELAGGRDAPATLEAYATELARWKAWCDRRGIDPLVDDPRMLCLYIAHLDHEGLSASTVEKSIAAVSRAYREFGRPTPARHPMVRGALGALGRERRAAGETPRKAAPLGPEEMAAICETLSPYNLAHARDRALLCLGLKLGVRRSELVRLTVERLDWRPPRGMVVRVWRKKTDTESLVAVSRGARPKLCPVATVEGWLERAGIDEGPIFRGVDCWGNVSDAALHPNSLNPIIKRLVERVDGLDAADYSTHSLRRGFVTAARRNKQDLEHIRRVTGHASLEQLVDYEHIDEVFAREVEIGL